MKRLAIALVVLWVAATAVTPLPRSEAAPSPLNVIVMVTDDQTPDSLANMPYLASGSGAWSTFPNAFFELPLCCPGRASILTGQYSQHTGVERNDGAEDGRQLRESSTIATDLDARYNTALIGKYMNGWPWDRGDHVPPGWDRWVTYNGDHGQLSYTLSIDGRAAGFPSGPNATTVFGDYAVDFVKRDHGGEPFFLYFAPPCGHSPWDAGPYDGTPVPTPVDAPPEQDVTDKPAWLRSMPLLDMATVHNHHKMAFRSMRLCDDQIARIDAALKEKGKSSNTIFIYTSDNGFEWGFAGRVKDKQCPYEGCVLNTLRVRWPGVGSRQVTRMTSIVDLAPTILDVTGTQTDRVMDGVSLTPLLRGQQPGEWRSEVYFHSLARGGWDGVRTADGWKYIEYSSGECELYDLSTDPNEAENRCLDPTLLLKRLELATLLHTRDP